MRLRFVTPCWGFVSTFVLAFVCVAAVPADAQPKKRTTKMAPKPAPAPITTAENPKPDAEPAAPAPVAKKDSKKTPKEQNFNFEGLGLNGRSRSPQLLYFLERANEELERASLEKRSFIPHMVRSVEEEAL
jgi:hypothetical protein